ncbi:SDR family NAD(P)-dependent oxidoreductase [Reichenbachiella sp.]|uniref:SDR family NAD(P)-dependent oxidoreductase n=1 Tax=Reichenbachiella sp. TaxID=2184521 RepID=UPI0032985749
MNIIITGGYSGIGLELTKMLFDEGHKLGLIIRNKKKSLIEIDPLFESKDIDFFYGDLSKDDETLDVIKAINDRWNSIDVLFNNAGLLTDKAYYSNQGNEIQFEVNARAPYILTYGLKPLLEKSNFSTVITTSTSGMHKRQEIDIQELKRPKRFVKLLGSYRASKFASALMMNQFAKENPHVMVRMVAPGPSKTNMTKGVGMPNWLMPLRNLFFSKPKKAAKRIYEAAFGQEFRKETGVYISNRKIKPIDLELSFHQIIGIIGDRGL